MSKIFTDAQIETFKSEGHPIFKLMEEINAHTNSLEYAATNLAMLSDIAEENLKAFHLERARVREAFANRR